MVVNPKVWVRSTAESLFSQQYSQYAMIIEVTGTNTQNKGAELMLVAIREHFAGQSEVQLAVNQFFGSYPERANYGLWQKVRLNGWGRSRVVMELMPREFRRSSGLVRDDEVDVVLDASGFAFGDQHPAERTIEFARRVEAAKQAGKKVVLLPQALGPFGQSEIRAAFSRIVDAADLVFARDNMSMEHAQQATGNPDHLYQAPDFTNLIRPERSVRSDASDRACIVPNRRMVEHAATEAAAGAYVPFMGRCIEIVDEGGLRPVLLLHEAEDDEIAAQIQRHVGRDLSVHRNSDPVALKRFLGESHLVVASRFHALVGALSQGVPAIGTSWSHKYEQLFREYDCADMLLSVSAAQDTIRACVRTATGDRREALRERLDEQRAQLEQRTEEMWRRVDEVLNLSRVAR